MIRKLTTTNKFVDKKIDDLPEDDSPVFQFEARWIESVDELNDLEKRWNRLATVLIRKNLQFESNFLIPAFQHLSDQNVRILVIEAPQAANPQGTRVLCGLLPLSRKKIYYLPLPCLEIWRSDQCFDTTPLIRQDCGLEVLEFIFDFLASEGTSLLSMDPVAADGKINQLLCELFERRDARVFQRNHFSRAAFRPESTFDEYLKTRVSKSVRRNVKRLERRLSEQGQLTVEVSNNDSDFAMLAQQFLDLESSGWKGEKGTALACDPSATAFFEQMVARSSAANRVSFLSLNLDDKPIAMLCDLQADEFGCSYKTAFDESYSKYSPGLLAEIKNIDHMHKSNIQLMDSCTDPDNATINRIWPGTMKFQSLVIPLDGGLPDLATRIMPLIQATARNVKRLIKK